VPLATYFLAVSSISRAVGRTSTAAAAYRAGQRLEDSRTGEIHDYTRRQGVEHTEVVIPTGIDAAWARDREQLWNAAEQAERRKDAKVAREVTIGLPHELSEAERVITAREFAQAVADRHQVAVDLAIHGPDRRGDQRNHHAHLLITTRRLEADKLGAKTRELDVIQTAGPHIEQWRRSWADIANRALERAKVPAAIDHRSYERQGVDREPEPKQGPVATALQRRGRPSFAGADRQAVRARNVERNAVIEIDIGDARGALERRLATVTRRRQVGLKALESKERAPSDKSIRAGLLKRERMRLAEAREEMAVVHDLAEKLQVRQTIGAWVKSPGKASAERRAAREEVRAAQNRLRAAEEQLQRRERYLDSPPGQRLVVGRLKRAQSRFDELEARKNKARGVLAQTGREVAELRPLITAARDLEKTGERTVKVSGQLSGPSSLSQLGKAFKEAQRAQGILSTAFSALP
jgi:hypothetical protein